MEDSKIIDLFWQRDQAAIQETDIKYGRNCRSIAFGILTSREDAEECVDDSYLKTWESIPPHRPGCLPAYLYRIIRNISFNRVKERYAQKRGGGEATLIYEELEDCIASTCSVEAEIETEEIANAINEFLHTLHKDDRIIFVYRYWLTLPTAEIAKRLGFKDGKVRTSLSRSRNKLHKYLIEKELI